VGGRGFRLRHLAGIDWGNSLSAMVWLSAMAVTGCGALHTREPSLTRPCKSVDSGNRNWCSVPRRKTAPDFFISMPGGEFRKDDGRSDDAFQNCATASRPFFFFLLLAS
jgi:hypothetical protein